MSKRKSLLGFCLHELEKSLGGCRYTRLNGDYHVAVYFKDNTRVDLFPVSGRWCRNGDTQHICLDTGAFFAEVRKRKDEVVYHQVCRKGYDNRQCAHCASTELESQLPLFPDPVELKVRTVCKSCGASWEASFRYSGRIAIKKEN